MSRRIFVIRDFEIKGIDISLEDLRRAPPEGYDEVIIPGLSGGRTQGQIFDDAVRRELMRATHVLAFVDLPNANVGFEIGYALGLGKAVALARVAGALPAWLTEPPLAGYLAPAARSAEQFRHLIVSDHWIEMPVRPTPGQDVLFMCPESGEGASLHGSRRRLRPDWKLLPSAGWSLPDLKSKLDGVGQLVWCLVPFAKDTDERDGRENAADAIVAGFASACGLELHVWRHAQARPVADLQQWEHRFSRLAEFEALLTRPVAEVKAAPPAPEEDPLPEVLSPPGPRSGWRPSARLRVSVAGACVMLVLAWFAGSSQPALRFAAERGVAAAQFQLALKLQEGRVGGADASQEAEALEWLRQAAEASHGPALMRLGDMHERGVGVPRDVNRAREYFHRAAELGLFEARLREAALLGKQLGGDGTQPPAGVASAARTGPATPVAGASAPAVKDRRWPNSSTLAVAFVGGKAQDRETVKRHAKQWSSYANIDFDFVAPGGRAEVRIAFDPSGGNWSYVGTDSKTNAKADQPTMNLAFVDEPTVLHQFGHVLGLLHEHQNPNARFDWNTDLMTKEMGWDRATLEENVTRRYSPSDYVIPKPFDPYSVMLYTFPASWTNGVVLNQGRVLSDTDKDYISKLYPGRWRSAK